MEVINANVTLQPAPVLSPEQIDKEIIVNYIRDSGSKITRMKVLRALYEKLNDAFFEWRRKYTEEAREECSENLTRLLVLTHPAYSIYDYALDEVLFYMNSDAVDEGKR